MDTEEKATLLAVTSRDSSSSRSSSSPELDYIEARNEADIGFSKRPRFNWKVLICITALVLAVLVVLGAVLGIGVAIGRNTASPTVAPTVAPTCPTPSMPNCSCSNSSTVQHDWGDYVTLSGSKESIPVITWFNEQIKAGNIKANLENLTAQPHIAGSEENHQLAVMIYNQWRGFGFDKVELVNYTVLLSYPGKPSENKLEIQDSFGNIMYNATIQQEPPLTPGENDPRVAAPFNAYSGNGTIKGPLVYVNYARNKDFQYLTKNLSMDLTGHVCIARYGLIFRGDKAHLAQRFNCSGLLIYSDPQQYAPQGVPVYPNGPSLPSGGVQRGSLTKREGDPLTPDIPAIDGVYRRPYEEAMDFDVVPTIPVQPISYGDAVQFMKQLSVHPAPGPDWVGKLSGLTYYISQDPKNTNKTVLTVNNYQQMKNIYNVIATIYGGVEPDRQVILGNHRDAWVFGAVDPNSATAVLMEIARTLSLLRENNWRPGRTLVLCSWDAEEYGLIGSTEWVEDRGALLEANTVAYLNVDSAVTGPGYISSAANPLMYNPLWMAAGMVKCPNTTYPTVYDQWLKVSPKNYNGTTKPFIANLGSGSDFTMFLQRYGITCSDFTYVNGTTYAVYHSVHDNFYWMTHFGDPDFSHHQAVGLFWVKTAMLLTTNPLLPYDPRYYALSVEEIFQNLVDQYSDVLSERNITLSYLNASVKAFSDGCVGLWEEVQRLSQPGSLSENIARIINDKYMNIERAFIHPEGLPGRSYFKHVLYAPSSVNSYGSSLFPGISDTIFIATQSNKTEDWNNVLRQIDIVRTHLRQATMILEEPTLMFAPN